jgi:hypothetical protein
MTPGAELETAGAIGEQLVARVVWHEDRCNRVVALLEEEPGASLVMTSAGMTR